MKKGIIAMFLLILFLITTITTTVLAADNELYVDKIDVTIKQYDGENSKRLGNTDTITILPNATLEFEVRLENTWPDNSETTYEDVYVRGIIYDIDDGDDIEEESDQEDIDPGDTETFTLKFQTPLRVDEDTYNMDLNITGYLNGSTKVNKDYRFKIKIEKESHKIFMTGFSVSPTTTNCGSTIQMQAQVTNIGKNDETVNMVVNIPEFNYFVNDSFMLDSDYDDDENSLTRTYSILVPKNIASGSYNVGAKAWYYKDKSAVERYSLVRVECAGTTSATQPTTQTPVITANITQEVETSAGVSPTGQVVVTVPPTTEKPAVLTWLSDWLIVIILAEIALIIFGVIILVAIKKR